MPRVKVAPVRRRMDRMELNEADDSVIDNEEVRRIETELENIRRRKIDQLQKLRRVREGNEPRGSPESSREYDVEHVEDNDQEDSMQCEPRSSARVLADGLDRAQQRYFFNVQRMEEKYAASERRGLPESFIEMDRFGNFFFPENMAGCHQQSFINRMFRRDAQFGKGLVSAPRNSIDSLDGNLRALKKCQQLDEKFGRKLRTSERLDAEVTERKDRVMSSVSDRMLKTESASTSSRFTDEVFEDLEDDVFYRTEQSYNGLLKKQQKMHTERRPTTSSMASFFDNMESGSDDEDFEDDEEDDEEESEESEETSEDDGEENEEEEHLIVAAKKKNVSNASIRTPQNRPPIKKESESVSPISQRQPNPSAIKSESIRMKTEPRTSPRFSVKKEVRTPMLAAPEIEKRTARMSSIKREPLQAESRIIAVVDLSDGDSSDLKKVERNRKITDFLVAGPKIAVLSESAPRKSPTSVPGGSQDEITRASQSGLDSPTKSPKKTALTPRSSRLGFPSKKHDGLENDEVKIGFTETVSGTQNTSTKTDNVLIETAVSTDKKSFDIGPTEENVIVTAVPTEESSISKDDSRPPVRPTRNRKPTSKVIETKLQSVKETSDQHEHIHGHSHSDDDQPSTSIKHQKNNGKKSRAKSPYCKHCEIIKEEKKQARLSERHKKTEEAGTAKEAEDKATPQTRKTPRQVAIKKSKSEEISTSEKKTPNTIAKNSTARETPKSGKIVKQNTTPDEESSGKKRRSATVGSDEPKMKKTKLTEVDLISIPSSMAVIVDTELIASENSQLVSEGLSKFSENSPDVSIWKSEVDLQWLSDVRKAAKKAKQVQFFGVPIKKVPLKVPMIEIWAENIVFGFDKDPFQCDLRRVMAQNKKARIDVKAGYDVRR